MGISDYGYVVPVGTKRLAHKTAKKRGSKMRYQCTECWSCCIIDADKKPVCCPCGDKGWKELVFWLEIEL
jgi:hypothetical protein